MTEYWNRMLINTADTEEEMLSNTSFVDDGNSFKHIQKSKLCKNVADR